MALPKVTPGTYNYGEYANPTPIRYNTRGQEAIGRAIGQGLQTLGQVYGQQKQKEREDKKADEIFTAKVIQDSYSRVNKEARKRNTEEVTRFANQAADLAVKFRSNLITAEEYTSQITAINDALDSLNTIEGLKNQIDLDNIPPVLIKDKQSLDNYALQMALQNGNERRIWDETEKDWFIEYDVIDPSELNAEEIKNLNGIPDRAYGIKRLAVSELNSNPKNYLKINLKIQETDKAIQDVYSSLANDFNKNQGRIYMTNVSENGYELLDETKAIENYKNSNSVDITYKRIGKSIAEDILGIDFNAENEELVKTYIATKAVEGADKVGNKVSVEKPTEEKPDTTNNYIIKTPITDEQWRSVTQAGGDKSIANMANLVSPYGFSVVGSPIASESGESEIGYNVKDNVTNKTIKIFKSDTPQQIRKKMADLRGLDIYSSFITPSIK